MELAQTSFHDLSVDFPKPGEFLSETDFAHAIGAEQPTISKLLKEGVLTRGADARQWLKQLYVYYSESSAGRRGNGPLDLVQERARLAREQADKTNFELRRLRGEFVPCRMIVEAMSDVHGRVRVRLLQLPHTFKSTFREIPSRQIVALDNLIRDLLTELSRLRLTPEIAKRLDAWQESGQEIYSDEKNEAK
jgi:phage terminase Nu1 subunit (DNA packaging protein)